IILNGNKKILFLAIMFHVSSIITYITQKYIAPLTKNLTAKNFFYIFIGIIIAFIVIYILSLDPRVMHKINFYSSYGSPGFSSGLSDLYIIIVIWSISTIQRKHSTFSFLLKLSLIVALCIILKGLAIYSYAFLRVIKLIMLGFVIYYSRDITSLKFNGKVFLSILLLIPYTLNYFISVFFNPELYM
uniref:hypothetical protein n=1 Tax=Moellerella wisconsensis TaxID=158849 RepID=UPI000640FA01